MRRCEWIDALALEAQEQVLAVGVDALDRAAGEPLGPAVGREARMGRTSSSGTRPSSTGRIRCAAWWMVSPSGIAVPEGTGPDAQGVTIARTVLLGPLESHATQPRPLAPAPTARSKKPLPATSRCEPSRRVALLLVRR